MRPHQWFRFRAAPVLQLSAILFVVQSMATAQAGNAPLPDIRQLMREVIAHQRQLEKVRENYTYNSFQTIQEMDADGKVRKTETEERNNFFVNSHLIERIIKKDGRPLSGHDEEKEQDRVTKLVEKAQRTPPGQLLEDQSVSLSQLLELMDVRNPRRILFRGRPTFVFDFIGRRNAKTHGLVEDASKKLQGTMWIDEADRQVAHLEVSFNDNFRVAGGLFATVDKGSNLEFDQAPVEGGLWLPTGGEANMQARLLMVKKLRQHVTERDFGFQQFHVETQSSNEAQAVPVGRP
jgi:hypothetical protein